MRYTTLEDRTPSCLVSAHDRISGTHRVVQHVEVARQVGDGLGAHKLGDDDVRHAYTPAIADQSIAWWRSRDSSAAGIGYFNPLPQLNSTTRSSPSTSP
jgi:hypothetical protein